MTFSSAAATGAAAEAAVADFLQSRGCQLLVRNFRGRYGEVDLIVRDGTVIAFVEVKARRSGPLSSLEAVDGRKRRRLTRIALEYVTTRRLRGVSVRFDVAAVRLGVDLSPIEIVYVPNAFAME